MLIATMHKAKQRSYGCPGIIENQRTTGFYFPFPAYIRCSTSYTAKGFFHSLTQVHPQSASYNGLNQRASEKS